MTREESLSQALRELFDSGNAIEDILQTPSGLGVSSGFVVQKAIDRFRESLKTAEGVLKEGGNNPIPPASVFKDTQDVLDHF